MELAPDAFPPISDPGGGPTNFFDGDFAGARLPSYLDKNGTSGAIQVLRLEACNGSLPSDPFLLRKSVEMCVGTKIDGAFPEGKEGITYALKVRSSAQVAKLLKLTSLSDGTEIKISEHPTLNTSRCVVNCSSVSSLNDETVLEGLASQGVRSIRRIKRRVGDKEENTSTIILTISGTVIPSHVDFGWIRCKTRPYYPTPMQCYNCWGFGHTSKRCKQPKPTCGTCSQEHAVDKETKCAAEDFCKRCDQHNHPLSSKRCPTYCKETEIQRIRVNLGISYPQAKRHYDQTHGQNSYSKITAAGKDQTITELSSKVDKLQHEMERKNKRIEILESSKMLSDNEMIEDLLQKLENLTSAMKQKDERIRALETALQSGSRISLVRKHGTIEDLVSKVTNLETKLERKEKEVKVLRTIFDKQQRQKQDWTADNSKNESAPKKDTKPKKEWKPTPMYESDTSPIACYTTTEERTSKRDHPPTDGRRTFSWFL